MCWKIYAAIQFFTYNISFMFLVQCPNGHTLCSNCKARVQNSCPTCRHELGNIRCLALEKVAESLELPCRFQYLGCQDIFLYYSKMKHEKNCVHRPYNCPYAGAECSVTGDIPYLVKHLKNDHRVDMHDGCTFNHRYVKSNPYEVENAIWMLTVRPLSLHHLHKCKSTKLHFLSSPKISLFPKWFWDTYFISSWIQDHTRKMNFHMVTREHNFC